jgi:phage terminase large subunit GpA-like protein
MVPGKGMLRFGRWLPDAWYSEMCVEVRTDKGWTNPQNRRNEAWDLAYYAMGVCVSPLIRVEGIDWTNPPGWASAWDSNSLVSVAETPRFKPAIRDEPQVSFADFARRMG